MASPAVAAASSEREAAAAEGAPPPLVRRRSAVPSSEPLVCGVRVGNDAWRHVLSFLSLADHLQALRTCAYLRALTSSGASWARDVDVGGALPWRLTNECVARLPPVDSGSLRGLWTCGRRRDALEGSHDRGVPSEAEGTTDRVLEYVARRCGGLEAVDILGASSLSGRALRAVAEGGALRFLGFAGACNDINGAAVAGAAPLLGRLEHLDLSFCRQLTSAGLAPALAAAGASLRSVNLGGCFLISDATAADLARHCPRLEAVSLARCHITHASVQRLAASCPALEQLDASFVEEMPAAALRALVKGCPRLRSVALEGCLKLGDSAVLELAGAPLLEEVNFRYCEFLGYRSLGALVRRCPRLAHLHLAAVKRVTDGVLDALVAGPAPAARSLVLSQCGWLGDAAVASLARAPLLEELSLERCRQLSDAALLPLASLPRLASLNVSWTRRVTSAALERVVAGCGRTLRRLAVSGNTAFGDAAVEAVARHCPLLERLEMASLTHVTDASVARLAALSRLRRLDVRSCGRLTDASMVPVARGCVFLERLAVSYLALLTPAFARAAAGLDLLRFLRAEGCAEETVAEARRLRPRLFDDDEDEVVVKLFGSLFDEQAAVDDVE